MQDARNKWMHDWENRRKDTFARLEAARKAKDDKEI